MADFNIWLNRANGRHIDIDGYYGAQCVDLDMDYAQWLFPGHGWQELIGYGNATDLYAGANPGFFEKIPYRAGFVPQQGDIGVIAGTPGNPEGHTYVVIKANASSQHVIEQNGYSPAGKAYVADRNYTNVKGFLRPRGESDVTIKPWREGIIVAYQQFEGINPTEAQISAQLGQPDMRNVYESLAKEVEARRKDLELKVEAGEAAKKIADTRGKKWQELSDYLETGNVDQVGIDAIIAKVKSLNK